MTTKHPSHFVLESAGYRPAGASAGRTVGEHAISQVQRDVDVTRQRRLLCARVTISLPDGLAMVLAREAKRLDSSVSEIVRQAITRRLGVGDADQGPGFIAIGRNGRRRAARNAESILAREWRSARSR